MTKTEMKTAILEAKKAKGMTWKALASAVGLSPAIQPVPHALG